MSLSGLAAGVLGQQGGGGGGAFDPETDISWHSLFWAEGTAFAAEGYSDTDSVDPWPNETSETDVTNVAQGVPTFVASSSPLNGQPAVDFGSGNSTRLEGTFTSGPSTSSGGFLSLVYVGEMNDVEPANRRCPIILGSPHDLGIFTNNGNWEAVGDNGSPESDAVGADNGAYLVALVCKANGAVADDVFNVDGTNLTAIDAERSATTFGKIYLGNNSNNSQHFGPGGHGALLGVYQGDIRADSAWSDFKSWVSSHYGISTS